MAPADGGSVRNKIALNNIARSDAPGRTPGSNRLPQILLAATRFGEARATESAPCESPTSEQVPNSLSVPPPGGKMNCVEGGWTAKRGSKILWSSCKGDYGHTPPGGAIGWLLLLAQYFSLLIQLVSNRTFHLIYISAPPGALIRGLRVLVC